MADNYEVKRYSRFWWGIIDPETKLYVKGKVGPYGLALFKTRQEALNKIAQLEEPEPIDEVWTNGSGPGYYETIDYIKRDLENAGISFKEYDDGNFTIFAVKNLVAQEADEIIFNWINDYERKEGKSEISFRINNDLLFESKEKLIETTESDEEIDAYYKKYPYNFSTYLTTDFLNNKKDFIDKCKEVKVPEDIHNNLLNRVLREVKPSEQDWKKIGYWGGFYLKNIQIAVGEDKTTDVHNSSFSQYTPIHVSADVVFNCKKLEPVHIEIDYNDYWYNYYGESLTKSAALTRGLEKHLRESLEEGLSDLINELKKAIATGDKKAEAKIRKQLEKVGMDIATQNTLIK